MLSVIQTLTFFRLSRSFVDLICDISFPTENDFLFLFALTSTGILIYSCLIKAPVLAEEKHNAAITMLHRIIIISSVWFEVMGFDLALIKPITQTHEEYKR